MTVFSSLMTMWFLMFFIGFLGFVPPNATVGLIALSTLAVLYVLTIYLLLTKYRLEENKIYPLLLFPSFQLKHSKYYDISKATQKDLFIFTIFRGEIQVYSLMDDKLLKNRKQLLTLKFNKQGGN